MKSSSLLLTLTATVISTTEAINLHKRQDGIEPRVVGLDLHRNHVSDPRVNDRNRRRKRDGSVNVNIDNEKTLYFLNASMGTPEQSIRFHLDTGSSDLWVNTADSEYCSTRSDPCVISGTYNANDSSTYEYVASNFNISYADGSGAAGDYATDTLHIGNQDIKSLQFGIGYESSSAQSILGIGYPAIEAQVEREGMKSYQNLPAKMAADGIIASNAYSIWLNDLNASTGTILFGGVDHSQYDGELVTLPIQKSGDEVSEFFITLTGISLGSSTIQDNLALAVLLDSGSSLTYLPDDIVSDIFNMVDAVYDEDEETAFVPCSLANEDMNMTFKFSDPASISVPINELVLDFTDITGRQLAFRNGDAACMFGIAPSAGGTNVLGDTFLRSAYVVFDLDNNEISLAQSNFNVTSTNIAEIGSGDDPVPSSTASDEPTSADSGLPGGGDSGNSAGNEESGAGVLSPSRMDTLVVGTAGFALGLTIFLA
ncbi:Fc.00g076700.m01.CDS01 [Cosmosporella sp. VM-42]